MKKLLVLAGLAFATAACTNPADGSNLTLLESTIVSIPQTVPAGSPFDVKLKVTTGGCTSFRNIDLQFSDGRAQIAAIGVTQHNKVCPDIQQLTDYVVTLPASGAGIITVVAKQPGGIDFTTQVQVK